MGWEVMQTIMSYQALGKIPPSYPNKCECGSDFVINDTFTITKCPNPLCYITISQRLLKTLRILNIKGFGEAWCEERVKLALAYNTPSHMKILYDSFNTEIQAIPITYPKYIELFCVNNLGSTKCQDIFSSVVSLQDFYTNLSTYELGKTLNISYYCQTITELYAELQAIKDEALFYESKFNITKGFSKSLNIVLTGEIDGYKPRELFVDYIQQTYHVNINLYSSVTKKIDYLVTDNQSMTSKRKKAIKYHIPIITHNDLENLLKEG